MSTHDDQMPLDAIPATVVAAPDDVPPQVATTAPIISRDYASQRVVVVVVVAVVVLVVVVVVVWLRRGDFGVPVSPERPWNESRFGKPGRFVMRLRLGFGGESTDSAGFGMFIVVLFALALRDAVALGSVAGRC